MVLTITANPAVDKVVTATRIVPREKIRCGDVQRSPGGGGVNVARVVHRLGGDVMAVWASGGAIGELYGGLLDREGVPHRAVPIEEETRENLIVREEESGDNFRFGMPGPLLSADEANALLASVEEAASEWVVASGSLPPGVDETFYRTLGERVKAGGGRFVLDTSGDALRRGVESAPYLLKPNLRELGQLVGRTIDDGEDAEAAAHEVMREHGVEVVLVSLGARGARLVRADSTMRLLPPDVDVKSSVGAGDSMLGALVHALAAGRSVEDAARRGVAAGAAAVTTHGFDLCHAAKVEELLGQVEIEGANA